MNMMTVAWMDAAFRMKPYENGVTVIPLTRASPQEIVVLIGMTQGGAMPLRFLRSLTIKTPTDGGRFPFIYS